MGIAISKYKDHNSGGSFCYVLLHFYSTNRGSVGEIVGVCSGGTCSTVFQLRVVP